MAEKPSQRSRNERVSADLNTSDWLMASVKQGTLTRPPQWWKHLRDWKRVFWKKERKAVRRDMAREANGNHKQ